MEQSIIKTTKKAISSLINLAITGEEKMWVDYDRGADVLYISFGKPRKADNAKESNGVITRTRNGKIVGLTVLNASSYSSVINSN